MAKGFKERDETPPLIVPVVKPRMYAGVDPGLKGCVAFYMPPQPHFEKGELHFIDLTVARGIQKHFVYHQSHSDLCQAIATFTEIMGKPILTMVETPHSMPNDGHVGAFTFGKACGMIEGMLTAFNMPMIAVVPAVWKPQMGLNSQKSRSIALAKEKFKDTNIPQGLSMFEKPKDHADGRAEAALLAWLAAHKLGKAT